MIDMIKEEESGLNVWQ